MLSNRHPLVILCYHGLTQNSSEHLQDFCFVSADKFSADLKKVADLGWRFLDLDRAVELLRLGKLSAPSVSLTFDDGFAASLALAGPILKEHSAQATVFLPTRLSREELNPWFTQVIELISSTKLEGLDFLGRHIPLGSDSQKASANRKLQSFLKKLHPNAISQMLNNLQLALQVDVISVHRERRLANVGECLAARSSGVFSFGAHSANHSIHSKLTLFELKKEIAESVGFLRDVFGAGALHYAYPNGQSGDFGRRCATLLREYAVDSAVTTIAGWNRHCSEPYALRRFCVGPQTDVGELLSSRKWNLVSRFL